MHVVRRVRQGGGTEGGQNGAGGGATAEVLAEQHDGQENRERGLEVQEERADDGRNTRETEQHEYRGGDSARGDDEEEKQEVDAAESRLARRRVRSLPSPDQCRRGDTETAFFELIEMTDDVLPAIVDIFRGEPQPHVRAFLVKAAWERREDAVIPFLAEALNDDAEEVWQEALDGLVAFSSQESLELLQSARSRKFKDSAAKRFHLWLEEAIQQVQFELRAKA